jgi:hypothetical protein
MGYLCGTEKHEIDSVYSNIESKFFLIILM